MIQTWLHVNRRVYLWMMAPLTMIGLAGLFLVGGAGGSRLSSGDQSVGWLPVGWLLVGSAIALVALLARRAWLPRLALRRGQLLVYLDGAKPIEVPAEIVECFLLGQGPSFLPFALSRRAETLTVVIRLAESAHQWQHVEVNPRLGSWCDGYVNLRGTWCEPLGVQVINRLNRKLADAHRAGG